GQERACAHPASGRGSREHDRARSREHEQTRALADGPAIGRLHVREHVHAPGEAAESSHSGAALLWGPHPARGDHEMFHARRAKAPPPPEGAETCDDVTCSPARDRPALSGAVLREDTQPSAARVHTHRPCVRHGRHFLSGTGSSAANCGFLATSSMGKIEQHTGEPIKYESEQVDGGDACALSTVVTPKGAPIDIE